MSLDFNFKKVRDWEAVANHPNQPEQWHPVAHALVMLTMVCGYREITDKNHKMVADRIMAYQGVTGPYFSGGPDKPGFYLKPADVERFIGLQTNASTLTQAEWYRHLADIAQRNGRSVGHSQGLTALQTFEQHFKEVRDGNV